MSYHFQQPTPPRAYVRRPLNNQRQKSKQRYYYRTFANQPLLPEQMQTTTAAARTAIASPRGHFELTNVSMYRPPEIRGVGQNRMARDDGVVASANDDRWIRHPAHSIVHSSVNANPAQDRAWCLLSQGFCCCQCVRTQQVGFVENCGAFDEIVGPGLYCMAWPFATIAGRLSLRIQQVDVVCETKTKDNVFCRITTSVLFRVSVVRSYEAYYRLVSPTRQIQTYVLDSIRSTVPNMTLDQVFLDKQRITEALFTRLCPQMSEYGYEITDCLITHVEPNSVVKDSMNEMNASRRYKQAAPHKAEARRVDIVKRAEAHAEALYASGKGTARGRQAIVDGMRESVDLWSLSDVRVAKPPTPKEVMHLLLLTQYMDTLASLGGRNSSASSLLVRHEPTAVVGPL